MNRDAMPMPNPLRGAGGVASPAVASIAFDRHKYGPRLLADACDVASLPHFIKTSRPHRLAFHEVALITGGRGAIALDGVPVEVAPYRLCLTAPGEIRSWRLEGGRLEGLLAFFEIDQFVEAGADARFLASLPILDAPPRQRSLALTPRSFDAVADIVGRMTDELRSPDEHTADVLRATTCELLVALQRASGLRSAPPRPRAETLACRYGRLLDERVRLGEPVAAFAERLGVTVRHLNRCVRSSTGRTATELRHERLHLEARRLLLTSSLPVGAIAEALGFSDAPYFIRFFKRHASLTPAAFRARQGSPAFDRASPLPDGRR